jgi:hypothetical protein
VESAADQDASFAGRAFNDSFCQNLPLGRRETVWQQCALILLKNSSCEEGEPLIQ